MPQKKGVVIRNSTDEAPKNKKRTNHLLIIGIDKYGNGISPLNNAVKDATDFKDLLLSQYQFEKKNLTLLFNAEATRSNILETFATLLDKLTETDNLIFYYSGHGEQLTVGSGKRGYWIPTDAVYKKSSSYIPNDEITLLFQNSKAQHIFGIVDSCFSGSLFKTRQLSTAAERVTSFPSRWLLTAGRLELVSDGNVGENSPFAKTLLTYLGKNEEAGLWVADLCNWVLKGMEYNVEKQTPRGEALQNSGHYGGQFIFYKKGYKPPLEAVKPKEEPTSTIDRGLNQVANKPKTTNVTLTTFKAHLKSLIIDKGLGEAIDTFRKHLKSGASLENDMIGIAARFNGLSRDIKKDIIARSDAQRETAKINYALTSYIDDLEATDVQLPTYMENPTNISDEENNTNILSELERAGLQDQAELLQRKINHIKKALTLETDPSRQFAYEEQIAELQGQLDEIKKKLG